MWAQWAHGNILRGEFKFYVGTVGTWAHFQKVIFPPKCNVGTVGTRAQFQERSLNLMWAQWAHGHNLQLLFLVPKSPLWCHHKICLQPLQQIQSQSQQQLLQQPAQIQQIQRQHSGEEIRKIDALFQFVKNLPNLTPTLVTNLKADVFKFLDLSKVDIVTAQLNLNMSWSLT